jgi:predicted lipoprotein with Yx(FWY)xxD motif/cytochrome c5
MNQRQRLLRSIQLLALTVVISFGAASAQSDDALVLLAEHDEHGTILVNSEGFALYIFLNDSAGVSVCVDACATNWPPLLLTGAPIVGEGLDPLLVGALVRADGAVQMTYNGWPLYTFIRDTEPGTTAGQGVNDVWYLLSPTGEGIGLPAAAELSFDELMRLGGAVFNRNCAVCHGPDGNQALASHTAIIDGYRRLSDATRTIRVVINGRGYMPAVGANFSNEEVAAVVTYVRNSWSNSHGPVSVADVEAAR